MTNTGHISPAAHEAPAMAATDGFPGTFQMRSRVETGFAEAWAAELPDIRRRRTRERSDQHHAFTFASGFGTGSPSTMSCRRSKPNPLTGGLFIAIRRPVAQFVVCGAHLVFARGYENVG